MHLSPDEERSIREDFDSLVNLEPAELKAWLDRPESQQVGMIRKGETESVGRQSAKKILAIKATPVADLTDADYRHMKKVIGFCRRHLAQRPQAWKTGGDVHDTRWRWSLMNWGHDPLRVRRGG
jgi:Protein of unknown function (DUF3140)